MGKAIHLAVADDDGLQSSVWKLWTQGDEIYLAQASVSTRLVAKLTIHKSGKCRFATTPPYLDHLRWSSEADPRVGFRWEIPALEDRDWCFCFHLVVPNVNTSQRFSLVDVMGSERGAHVIKVEPAAPNRGCVLSLLQAPSHDLLPSDYLDDPHEVLAHVDLRSGPRVWVIRTVRDVSQETRENLTRMRDSVRLKAAGSVDKRFMSAMVRAEGVPTLFEIAGGADNWAADDEAVRPGVMLVDQPYVYVDVDRPPESKGRPALR